MRVRRMILLATVLGLGACSGSTREARPIAQPATPGGLTEARSEAGQRSSSAGEVIAGSSRVAEGTRASGARTPTASAHGSADAARASGARTASGPSVDAPAAKVAQGRVAEPLADDAQLEDRFFDHPDAPVRQALASGEIVRVEHGRGGRSIAFVITLADGTRGYFKPSQTFNGTQWYAEIAAYHLDRELGLGRVAPVVARRIPWSELRGAAAHDARIHEIRVDDDGTVLGAFVAWVPARPTPLPLPRGWERWLRIDDALPRITPFQRPGQYRRARERAADVPAIDAIALGDTASERDANGDDDARSMTTTQTTTTRPTTTTTARPSHDSTAIDHDEVGDVACDHDARPTTTTASRPSHDACDGTAIDHDGIGDVACDHDARAITTRAITTTTARPSDASDDDVSDDAAGDDVSDDAALEEVGAPDRPERPAELSDMIAFDYLTHNLDRWGGHNTNVRTVGEGGPLMYLDNAAAFTLRAAHVRLSDTRLATVQRFRRSTIDAIRALDVDHFAARLETDPLAPTLDARQLENLAARRERLLAYVDALVEEHGEDAVYAF